METFYLFLVIFLFVLAIVDLSVGVSNDAVNFLNSAIGARAASFKVIIAIAAVGVFVGRSGVIQCYDGYRPAWYLSTPAFLFLGDHVYPCGRYAYGCGATGYF